MTPEEKAKLPLLDEKSRAEKVLISQGRAAGIVAAMSPEELEGLAALCDDKGELVPDLRARFSEWKEVYLDKRRADKIPADQPDQTT